MSVTYHLTLIRFHRYWSMLDAFDIKSPRSLAGGILDEDQLGISDSGFKTDPEDGGGVRLEAFLELHTESFLVVYKVKSLVVHIANFNDLSIDNFRRVTPINGNGEGTLIIEGFDWVG